MQVCPLQVFNQTRYNPTNCHLSMLLCVSNRFKVIIKQNQKPSTKSTERRLTLLSVSTAHQVLIPKRGFPLLLLAPHLECHIKQRHRQARFSSSQTRVLCFYQKKKKSTKKNALSLYVCCRATAVAVYLFYYYYYLKYIYIYI